VSVEHTGNDKIRDEKIDPEIHVKVGDVYDARRVEEDRKRILELYKKDGYVFAEVTAKEARTESGGVNLTYAIDEGSKVEVKEIVFSGNTHFKEREIRKVIATKRHNLLSWLTGSGVYNRDLAKVDSDRIRSLYHNHGYIEAKVGTPKVVLSEDRKEVTVTFPIVEGRQFTIHSVTVRGNDHIATDELVTKLETAGGETYSREDVRKDIARLTEQYGNKGYFFVDIVPRTMPVEKNTEVDIVFDIDEGKQAHIGRIDITGNDRTRDKVIRRELRFQEGDLYNSQGVRRSFERLNNLGYFDNVEIIPNREVGTDILDTEIRVKERPTGSLTMGAGWGSADGFLATFSVSEANLLGTGRKLNLSLELGEQRTRINLRYLEPYILGTDMTGQVDVFNTLQQFNDFDRKSKGFGLTLSKQIGEYDSGELGYRLDSLKIEPASSDNGIEATDTVSSTLRLGWVRNTVDSRFDPTRGYRLALSGEWAGGPLGFDNDYEKLNVNYNWFHKLLWKTVFGLHLRTGYLADREDDEQDKEDIYRLEGFYLGGINSLRGYEPRSVGPKSGDLTGQPHEGIALGGNFMLLSNIEVTFPLVQEAGLKGVLFLDAGDAWGREESVDLGDLKYSAGFGVRWLSPMGPLRLEWGYKLSDTDDVSDTNDSRFEFSIGSFF
jgi:outer membrane protein insertion porin family